LFFWESLREKENLFCDSFDLSSVIAHLIKFTAFNDGGIAFHKAYFRAMATAVSVASPVIHYFIFIPASPHLLMASEPSGIGGLQVQSIGEVLNIVLISSFLISAAL